MGKDTIYREDAIKAIEDVRCWLTLASQHGDMGRVLWDEYYIKFEDAIEALLLISSADRPQEWIPCSERLPEYGVPVLTWDGSMWTVEQRIPFVLDDDLNRIYSEWWVDADFDEVYEDARYYPNLRDGAAVAWMPLPKPLKGADGKEQVDDRNQTD